MLQAGHQWINWKMPVGSTSRARSAVIVIVEFMLSSCYQYVIVMLSLCSFSADFLRPRFPPVPDHLLVGGPGGVCARVSRRCVETPRLFWLCSNVGRRLICWPTLPSRGSCSTRWRFNQRYEIQTRYLLTSYQTDPPSSNILTVLHNYKK